MNEKTRNHILSLIPEGKQNAVSMRQLAKMLDCSQRELRRLILMARIEGNLILSDENGYFVSHDQKDVRRYYHRIVSRQKSTAMAAAAVRRELKKTEDTSQYEQMSLFKEVSI